MSLDKGSKLAREESREKRKIRSSALQDMLDEQIQERQKLLKKKAELDEIEKSSYDRKLLEKFEQNLKAEKSARLERTAKSERKRKSRERQSTAQAEDIAQAKHKAAKIREQGMKEYKQQLLKELEVDRLRKVRVVFILYVISLLSVLVVYFSNTSFEEIEKIIVQAMQVNGEDLEVELM